MAINFFNYEACFLHYTSRIQSIRQAKIKGEVIVAKPVLLLSIIDSIEANEIGPNRIRLTMRLEDRYYALMRKYARGSQFDNPTKIETPFWHLQSDGFWHLSGIEMPESMSATASRKYIDENVDYAYLDEELWLMLQNAAMRIRLREYIIEHKLPHNDDGELRFVADGAIDVRSTDVQIGHTATDLLLVG